MASEKAISEESIRQWLVEAVARYVRVDVTRVRPTMAFEDIGLSSLAAVSLSAELSDAFGIDVDPLLTWEYPTIAEAARAIAQSGVCLRKPA
jgi:acyl carrier protein